MTDVSWIFGRGGELDGLRSLSEEYGFDWWAGAAGEYEMMGTFREMTASDALRGGEVIDVLNILAKVSLGHHGAQIVLEPEIVPVFEYRMRGRQKSCYLYAAAAGERTLAIGLFRQQSRQEAVARTRRWILSKPQLSAFTGVLVIRGEK